MQIGRMIGMMTLTNTHPTMVGARLRLVVPQSLSNLRGDTSGQQEPIVVYDELGAGIGSLIAFSEGREAAQPFDPEGKPIDAYNAAILDRIDIS